MQKKAYVTKMFNDIARPYDRLNQIISLGRDEAWRRRTLELAGVQKGWNAADLGCGTGDLYLQLREAVGGEGSVVGIDVAEEMLAVARGKVEAAYPGDEAPLHCAGAESTGLESERFDLVTMAWVLRNVGDRQATYREVTRILKPGGTFACIDMSQAEFAPLRWGSALYMKTVMPLFVRALGGDLEAYRYLTRSTERFPRKKMLADEWTAAGFVDVRFESCMLGSIGIHTGRRPRKENS